MDLNISRNKVDCFILFFNVLIYRPIELILRCFLVPWTPTKLENLTYKLFKG